MADLREELEKRTSELEDMQKQKASEERTTKNFQRELDINQKELQFLREELRDTKVRFGYNQYPLVHPLIHGPEPVGLRRKLSGVSQINPNDNRF